MLETLKTFAPLSEFKDRSVELYRSSDIENTKKYFLNDKESPNPYFEILKFGYFGGNNQIYIRYPDTQYFVELVGHYNSSWGKMESRENVEDIWKDKIYSYLNLKFHDKNLMIDIGSKDYKHQFNFLTRIASMDKGNKDNLNYPNYTYENYSEIENALSLNYLKLPFEIKVIDSCFKTKDNVSYYLTIYPSYYLDYKNYQMFEIKNNCFKELHISDITRYRDGGTTYIKTKNNNVLYYPSRFNKENKNVPKFDETELIECSKEEQDNLIKILNISLEKEDE